MTIATIAGFFGITLPFAVYTGASATVGILSGPIGWTLIAVGTIVTVGLAGRADVRKTLAGVLEIHALKVAALEAAGEKCPSVPMRRASQ